KLERQDQVLRESDYRRFIEEKTPAHPELLKRSESTSGKVRSVLFAMLREAGILSKGNEIGLFHRPVIPYEVEHSIRAENPEWLAAFLFPENEIKAH
ncbi:MAG: BrxA family protein, partial [Luteolibacter sp.]